ncbi:prephenate dehydratase [Aspergillus wentii]|nr:prephenate dehydratase [Aspergillus wentii]
MELRVTFLGPAASFSHQAAVETFGTSAELSPCLSFADAFAAVQQGKADYAIIPFENSTNGSVVQTLDLLADRLNLYGDVTVCGEHYLTVHHCLMIRKDHASSPDRPTYDSITKLYTHPQAWGQCDIFLDKHFKGVERQDVSSTSKAAEIVSKETTERSAAIASHFAASYHGVEILAENIEDKADNTTRFLVLGNAQLELTARVPFENVKVSSARQQPGPLDTTLKTLISFMVNQDFPGALAEALLIFKAHGVNLTSINTRPSKKRAWQYVFFVECKRIPTAENKEAIARILHGLQEVTENCRDLGTWKDELPSN